MEWTTKSRWVGLRKWYKGSKGRQHQVVPWFLDASLAPEDHLLCFCASIIKISPNKTKSNVGVLIVLQPSVSRHEASAYQRSVSDSALLGSKERNHKFSCLSQRTDFPIHPLWSSYHAVIIFTAYSKKFTLVRRMIPFWRHGERLEKLVFVGTWTSVAVNDQILHVICIKLAL